MNDWTNGCFSSLHIFSGSLFHMAFNFSWWEVFACRHARASSGWFAQPQKSTKKYIASSHWAGEGTRPANFMSPSHNTETTLDVRTITKITIKSRSTSSGFMCDQKFRRRAIADERSVIKAESLLHLHLTLATVCLLAGLVVVVDDAEANQNKL